jgi:hypothetical protein
MCVACLWENGKKWALQMANRPKKKRMDLGGHPAAGREVQMQTLFFLLSLFGNSLL